MAKKNVTACSIAGSLGAHMLFTLGAGSFLMDINKIVQPQKTYKLEFVKRKTPPPVKKEEIRKETARREIKVASLAPKPAPAPAPRLRRAAVRQTRKAVAVPAPSPASRRAPGKAQRQVVAKAAIMRNSAPAFGGRAGASAPRSVAPASHVAYAKGGARAAMVRGVRYSAASRLPKRVAQSGAAASAAKGLARAAVVKGSGKFKLGKLPGRAAMSGNSSPYSGAARGRAAPARTGARLASLASLPSSREAPDIADKGALENYISRVQRIIAGAKRYPEASRRAGRQGKLKVQFTILKNGEVENVRLLTKTPYPNLNREAVAAVKRAAPFSGIPESVMKQSLRVVLPFRFELN